MEACPARDRNFFEIGSLAIFCVPLHTIFGFNRLNLLKLAKPRIILGVFIAETIGVACWK
jgi:hypothetical protein